MAARKTKWTPEIVRQRIRVGQLVRRLQDHALGLVDMTPTQITAALGVLKKAMPDLSATELMAHIQTGDITDKPMTPDEWAKEYGGAAEEDRLAASVGSAKSTH